jgi:hypothetical protein
MWEVGASAKTRLLIENAVTVSPLPAAGQPVKRRIWRRNTISPRYAEQPMQSLQTTQVLIKWRPLVSILH